MKVVHLVTLGDGKYTHFLDNYDRKCQRISSKLIENENITSIYTSNTIRGHYKQIVEYASSLDDLLQSSELNHIIVITVNPIIIDLLRLKRIDGTLGELHVHMLDDVIYDEEYFGVDKYIWSQHTVDKYGEMPKQPQSQEYQQNLAKNIKQTLNNKFNIVEIDAKDYALVGTLTGERYAKEYNLLEHLEASDTGEITIKFSGTNQIMAIVPTFFVGMFYDIVKKIGRNEFRERVNIITPGYNHERVLNEALHRISTDINNNHAK